MSKETVIRQADETIAALFTNMQTAKHVGDLTWEQLMGAAHATVGVMIAQAVDRLTAAVERQTGVYGPLVDVAEKLGPSLDDLIKELEAAKAERDAGKKTR